MRQLTWDRIDLEKGTAWIPGAKMKNGQNGQPLKQGLPDSAPSQHDRRCDIRAYHLAEASAPLGLENIGRYEHRLLSYAKQGLQTVPGLRLIGTAREQASLQSFVVEGYRPEEVGTALNREGIAVRVGHHCAQPIMRRFGVEATVRPSFAFYNTCAEIDVLVSALHRLAHQVGRAKR